MLWGVLPWANAQRAALRAAGQATFGNKSREGARGVQTLTDNASIFQNFLIEPETFVSAFASPNQALRFRPLKHLGNAKS